MSEILYRVMAGVRCSGRRCGETIEGPEMDPFKAREYYTALAVAEGWRLYSGRTRLWYCPACGPARGHKMRLIAGEVVGEDQ